jgi:succinate dehydrogenase/fumarate reductase flavoprotein subunit
MASENIIETDVLVVGGGIAGCFAAIKAKEKGLDVTQVDRGHVGKSGESVYPCCLDIFKEDWGHDMERWLWHIHYKGEFLNDQRWTELTFKDSWDRFQDRLSWGEEFIQRDGKYVTWPAWTEDQFDAESRFPVRTAAHPKLAPTTLLLDSAPCAVLLQGPGRAGVQ